MTKTPAEVTRLLEAWSSGDDSALDRLMPLVEGHLREIAARHFRSERLGHTLQPTALVSELYIDLTQRMRVNWRNRAHFFGTAADMMRRILVDHARGHIAKKRGGGQKPLSLEESWDQGGEIGVDVLALDDALKDLEKLSPHHSRVVVLRFFAGLTFDECAEVMEISVRSAKRYWKAARVWLFEYLTN